LLGDPVQVVVGLRTAASVVNDDQGAGH
jgi:hypothetical protein